MNEPVFFLKSKRFHSMWIAPLVSWAVTKFGLLQTALITQDDVAMITSSLTVLVVGIVGMAMGKRAVALLPKGKGQSTLKSLIVLAMLFAAVPWLAGCQIAESRILEARSTIGQNLEVAARAAKRVDCEDLPVIVVERLYWQSEDDAKTWRDWCSMGHDRKVPPTAPAAKSP